MKSYELKSMKPPDGGKSKIDYESELNEAQYQAVTHLDGPLLVIAGAGSGKTRTLVYRVARLVEMGVSPQSILLLTFTRKAAREMLSRAEAKLDERCGRVSGGTFHSFANVTLRRYSKSIGYDSNFTILDQSDSRDVINRIRSKLGYYKKESRFPRKQTIQTVISKSINKSVSIEQVLEEEYPHYIELSRDISIIWKEYVEYKRRHMMMDYDDLLVYLKLLLENNEKVRRKLSSTYKHIMVDEYQDTNRLQAHISALLASEHGNILVVGDDSQSIYSFRGANFKNIMDFPKIFKDTKTITLEENYRSTQQILNLTNEIIRHSKEKFSKELFTRRKGGAKPVFIETASDNDQSRFVVQKVLELREQGIPLKKIAVLFRAAWHSNDLEIELMKHNIPFRKFGGIKFIETAHVKDVIAHLRIVDNPLDSVSWQRVLLLIDGIGNKTCEQLIEGIVEKNKQTEYLKSQQFEGKRYSTDLSELYRVLKHMEALVDSPYGQMELAIKYYGPIMKKQFDDFNKREMDLETLLTMAARYKDIRRLLADIALEPPESEDEELPSDEEDDWLVLSTIHSAKGLEWHTVFIIRLIEGGLPSRFSWDDEDDIEEERRVFYVATTRAQDNLFLLKPNIDEYSVFTGVSRFLLEGDILEGDLVETWLLTDEEEHDGISISNSDDDEHSYYSDIQEYFSKS